MGTFAHIEIPWVSKFLFLPSLQLPHPFLFPCPEQFSSDSDLSSPTFLSFPARPFRCPAFFLTLQEHQLPLEGSCSLGIFSLLTRP